MDTKIRFRVGYTNLTGFTPGVDQKTFNELMAIAVDGPPRSTASRALLELANQVTRNTHSEEVRRRFESMALVIDAVAEWAKRRKRRKNKGNEVEEVVDPILADADD